MQKGRLIITIPKYILAETKLFQNLIYTYLYKCKKVLAKNLKSDKKLNELWFKCKASQSGKVDNRDEYGYFINESIIDVYRLMRKFHLVTMIDLGCGTGHVMEALQNLNIRVKGFEIESTLIKYADRNVKRYIKKKDITKLIKEDIKNSEVIYFWEPIASPTLAKTFIDNLVPLLTKSQYIIQRTSGCMETLLRQHKTLKYIGRYNSTNVFKKL